MSQGMLFSQMTPPEGRVQEFHDWYNTEHIPARMAISGFSHAIRYEQADAPGNFLAVYHLDDLSALETEEYKFLKESPSDLTKDMLESVSGFTRYITEMMSDTGHVDAQVPKVLYVVAFSVPEEDEEEFNSWYADEHVPLLMKVPGWLRVRRYRSFSGHAGPNWTHFALHELESEQALNAPERDAARDTARREKLAKKDWFDAGRWVFTPIHFDEAHASSEKPKN